MASVPGVDNTARRKWDYQEYLERARKREADEEAKRNKSKELPVPKIPLKHRDVPIDLTARVGKTQVVTQITPLNQQAGYFCKVCDCVVKDSANYLDHINGKKHQRALGMSMRVERSTLEQVQSRLETGKRKAVEDPEKDIAMRLLKQQEEEEERKRRKKERKKEKKREKTQDAIEDIDPEVAEAMGFGGFGSTKKSA